MLIVITINHEMRISFSYCILCFKSFNTNLSLVVLVMILLFILINNNQVGKDLFRKLFGNRRRRSLVFHQKAFNVRDQTLILLKLRPIKFL